MIRAGNPHLIDRQPGAVIKVINLVILITFFAVCNPYVFSRPVIQRIGVIEILAHFGCPLRIFHQCLARIGISPVTVDRLISPDADHTQCGTLMMSGIPMPKLGIQILLSHFILISFNRIVLQVNNIGHRGHRTHPQFFLFVIPGVPIHLIIADGAARSHRQTYPIRLNIVYVVFKHLGNIVCRQLILRLKILMENTDFFLNVMFAFIVKNHIQQQTAVFSAGERHINIVKIFKRKLNSFHRCVKNIHVLINLHSFKASSLDIILQTLLNTFSLRLRLSFIRLSSLVPTQKL